MSFRDRAVIASLRVLPQRYLSHLAGKLMSVELPAPLARSAVRGFARAYGIDVDEAAEPLSSYPSVQSFFVRALKDGARPIDGDPRAFVSPCDGAVGESGLVRDGRALQVKGRSYTIAALLDDDALARRFEGGAFCTLYLSPRDYHRFHAPCAGDVVSARAVPGALWPVNTAGITHVDGLFARNERIVAVLRPKLPGLADDARVAMVAVGATMVGKVRVTFDDLTTNRGNDASIERRYDPPHVLDKGQEWGRFEFGSTLVVVATPGLLDLDIGPPGTPVVLGRRIGALRGAASQRVATAP